MNWTMNQWQAAPGHPTDRLVYLIMSMNADEAGVCTLSQSELCAMSSLKSTRGMRKVLGRLIQRGYVSRIERPGRPNLYRLKRLEEGELEQSGDNIVLYERQTPEPADRGGEDLQFRGYGKPGEGAERESRGGAEPADRGGKDPRFPGCGKPESEAELADRDQGEPAERVEQAFRDRAEPEGLGGAKPGKGAEPTDRGRAEPEVQGRALALNSKAQHVVVDNKKQNKKISKTNNSKPGKDARADLVATAQRLLEERGVDGRVAAALLGEFGPEAVRRQVANYDRLLARGTPPRGSGWLVAAIRRGFDGPAEALLTYADMLAWCERRGDMRLMDRFEVVKEGEETFFRLPSPGNHKPQRP